MSVRSRIGSSPDNTGCIWRDAAYTYKHLFDARAAIARELQSAGVGSGDTVAVIGDYSPQMIAAHLAVTDLRAVTVPLPPTLHAEDRDSKLHLASVDHVISIDDEDAWRLAPGPGGGRHALIDTLVERDHAGLVVFTSGTTGQPKAVLHDFDQFLRQFDNPRRPNVTLAFFLPDHMAGLNTMFYALTSGGALVCVSERTPSTVCAAVERHRVQFLPTSPTFLQLVLLAGAHLEYDLSSLQLVTFGSEPMHERTLERLQAAFPSTRLHQVYGVSELNTLRSQPREPGSKWLRLRPDDYDVRIKNGTLWVKTESAMLGYLNAPSPFDEDGWFDTGDVVETDGDFVKVLGRKTEIINVGGDKVHPAEVENVILTMTNVRDATVFGQRHPIIGQIVAARVVLDEPEPLPEFKRRLRRHCAMHLARYKVPVKVEVVDETQYSTRFKRVRAEARPAATEAVPSAQ